MESGMPATQAAVGAAVRPRTVWRHLLPTTLISGLWRHRELIRQLTRREVEMRYRGSILGGLWVFLLPLGMLIVYTFVFGTVLRSRWGTGEESKVEFALTLFAGLVIFQIFSELINSSCVVITQNMNYVKKVVFPLEVLPFVLLLAIMVRAIVSIVILAVGLIFLVQRLPPTVLYFPLVLLPLVMLSLGFGWFLSSFGVFVRDIGQVIGVIANVLFFVTPIFYPISRLPESFRWIAHVNPLAFIVEDSRRVLIWNQAPQWGPWLIVVLISFVVMQLGYAWFMETKRGFADVL